MSCKTVDRLAGLLFIIVGILLYGVGFLFFTGADLGFIAGLMFAYGLVKI